MDTCPPKTRDRLRSLLASSATKRFDDPPSNKHWRQWCRFAQDTGQHPLLLRLQGPTQHLERSHLFLAFAAALRDGQYDGGRRASGAQITEALRFCAHCMVVRGFADPRKSDPGDAKLDQAISSYLDKCKDKDPPPQPQQALPSSTIRWILQVFSQAPLRWLQITAYLIVLAFFFLLRVGEYTPSAKEKRTVPLRGRDIKLWSQGPILSHT